METWKDWERRQADLEEMRTLGIGPFGKNYDLDWLDQNREEFEESVLNPREE